MNNTNFILYIIISIILIGIFINSQETFSDFNPSPNINSFYHEDKTSLPVNGIILSNKNKGFGNFGKFGMVPMMQNCSKCQLNDNCTNFDYTKSDNNMNVCQSCDMNQGLNYPYYVSAKTAGRGRKCRRILD